MQAGEVDGYDGVLLSPGAGTPERAGACIDLVHHCAGTVPLLGVCLGHQAIAVAYGATVDRAPELLHGKTSEVLHDGAGVLAGLPVAVHRDPLPLAGRRPGDACPPSWRSPAAPRAASSWRCATATSRWRACSSTPSRC